MVASLEVYEPPQCCATGACGPDAEDEVAQFALSLEWLEACGVSVSRYNLGHDPGAFVTNATVKALLDKEGLACLPLILADGRIVSQGRYPSRDELGARINS
jgi:hypothetical protein